jgi:regulator of sirC expression with transglutaminase-like and TPR domain
MQLDSPARARFEALLAEPVLRLDEAALALAAEEYPGLDVRACLDRLDDLAERVTRRVGDDARMASLISAVRDVLYKEEGFRGNEKDYYDARNSYLNQVLERRLGIPITLSLLFMEVGRRAGLPLAGVGFPGHFLVKLELGYGRELYIDAYNEGELLSADECKARFKHLVHGRDFDARYLQSVPPRQLLARMLHNLKKIYVEQGDDVRAFWVIDRLLLLHPDAMDEVRDRGLVEARLGLKPAAARDLEAYLAHAPPGAADLGEVRELLETIRARPAMLN